MLQVHNLQEYLSFEGKIMNEIPNNEEANTNTKVSYMCIFLIPFVISSLLVLIPMVHNTPISPAKIVNTMEKHIIDKIIP